jgi:hypothetical protein
MTIRSAYKAAGAIALAAFLCPVAFADAPPDPIETLPGYWGWDEGEVVGASFGTCDKQPLQIWFSEDGNRYHSRHLNAERGYTAQVVARQSSMEDGTALLIRYDEEARVDGNGDPVAWFLVMVDTDRFYWLRRDWVGHEVRTSHLVRCDMAETD